jgi:catechol 2,3-dioxygenase-like lactoylglutathione lyase family enzyme
MSLDQVIVFVKDLPRMQRFYCEGLQLEIVDVSDGWVRFAANGGASLALHAIPASIAAQIEVTDPPRERSDTPIKITFRVADVDAARARVAERGAHMREARRSTDTATCDGVDPEGNVFQLRASASVAFHRVAPVLPVRDIFAAIAHYRGLGFSATPYEGDGPEDPPYAFCRWGDVELHFTRFRELDPKTNTCACYLYVTDAHALHATWTAASPAGRLTPVEDTPYGLAEFAHVDPDGNLLRVGSQLP